MVWEQSPLDRRRRAIVQEQPYTPPGSLYPVALGQIQPLRGMQPRGALLSALSDR